MKTNKRPLGAPPTLDELRAEGAAARRAAVARWANPYRASADSWAQAWEQGWDEAGRGCEHCGPNGVPL